VSAQGQVGIRLEFEVLLEVRREGSQSSLLAGHEAAIGSLDPGLIGLEEDAMQCQASLECTCSGEGPGGGGAVIVTMAPAVEV